MLENNVSPSLMIFQSTLSVRRATSGTQAAYECLTISIHALRKESDPMVDQITKMYDISIHALRKESDVIISIMISS